MEKICSSCMNLLVRKEDPTESGAIPFWSRNERISNNSKVLINGMVAAPRVSEQKHKTSRTSERTTTTPGSSFLESQSANIEMTSTIERTPTPTPRATRENGDKPE